MLENWVFESSILKRISQHVETKEQLSDDLSKPTFVIVIKYELNGKLVKKIILARDHGQGLFNLRQLFFGPLIHITSHTLCAYFPPGTFDMHIHTMKGN